MESFILASQSPRRAQLMQRFGIPFQIEPSDGEEVFDPSLGTDKALEKVAQAKAEAISRRHPDTWVFASDTIVYDDGKILGKPASLQEAFDVLKKLSGRFHEVKTAIVLKKGEEVLSDVLTTKVHFRVLSDDEIWKYVDEKTCLDKAGSYGIQDTDFVDFLDGSFSNVVGLPLQASARLLEKAGFAPEGSWSLAD